VEKHFRARQATDGNMENVHCMLDTKDYTNTHSGCEILIALPLQQWLHDFTSMLRYTFTACLVIVLLKEIMFFYCGYFVTHRVAF
jgi:hypothetical protein